MTDALRIPEIQLSVFLFNSQTCLLFALVNIIATLAASNDQEPAAKDTDAEASGSGWAYAPHYVSRNE